MDGSTFSCKMCGRCCRPVIPLTLLDVNHMAEHLGMDAKQVFEKYIAYRAEDASLILPKDEHGRCPFLGKDNACAIHEAKPWVCRVYTCNQQAESPEGVPWAACYNNQAGHRELWRIVVARNETEQYAAKHGANWRADDFHAGVAAIRAKSDLKETQRIKLARAENGETRAVLYDCTGCKDRPTCCKEAPVTLDDITRLSARLDVPVETLFAEHVSDSPATLAEALLALRTPEGDRCPFLDPASMRCATEGRQPMHCQFIPCAVLVGQDQMAERFYLGSGTLEEQFRHQIATAVTRRYIAEYGTTYHPQGVHNLTKLLEQLAADRTEFARFCQTIAPHRYIDDNFLAMKQVEDAGRTH